MASTAVSTHNIDPGPRSRIPPAIQPLLHHHPNHQCDPNDTPHDNSPHPHSHPHLPLLKSPQRMPELAQSQYTHHQCVHCECYIIRSDRTLLSVVAGAVLGLDQRRVVEEDTGSGVAEEAQHIEGREGKSSALGRAPAIVEERLGVEGSRPR